jgi:hypothetical protein
VGQTFLCPFGSPNQAEPSQAREDDAENEHKYPERNKEVNGFQDAIGDIRKYLESVRRGEPVDDCEDHQDDDEEDGGDC